MTNVNIAHPDITLLLDMEGVIRNVTLSGAMPERDVETWLGRPWAGTVGEVGGDKVRRMIEDACRRGVSAFHQIPQRFPSGLELPIEYTTVRLGEGAGLIAIGKNLQAVAELQSRLIETQQEMERDYWRRREIETRYRLLFNASSEAVLLVRAAPELPIVEANAAATQALGFRSPRPEDAVGRDLLPELPAPERGPLREMLVRVREQGKAPGMLVQWDPLESTCRHASLSIL